MLYYYMNICFFNATSTTDIYTDLHTLSLHDALPIFHQHDPVMADGRHRLVDIVEARPRHDPLRRHAQELVAQIGEYLLLKRIERREVQMPALGRDDMRLAIVEGDHRQIGREHV